MVQQKEQYWVTKRKEDVNNFLYFLRISFEENGELSIEYLLNRYSMRTGFTPTKLRSYLDQLVKAELIILKDKDTINKVL